MYAMVRLTHADTGIEFYLAPTEIVRVENRKDDAAIVFTSGQGRINVKGSAEAVARAVATTIEWKESRAVAAQVQMMRQMQQEQQSSLLVPNGINLNGN